MKHAKLSASGSERWLRCPGSVKAEEGFSDKGSVHAHEGTCAHELAELVLSRGGAAHDWEGKRLIENNEHTVERVMCDYVQQYVDYVSCFNGEHFYEVRVDFSEYVPEGFGTSDCIIATEDTIRVIDLKYGKGVKVDADTNSQGMLYALGALEMLAGIYEPTNVVICIHQPRLDHVSEWSISVDDLKRWGAWVCERAELTLEANAERTPGEKQCQWCKAKATCPALEKFTRNVLIKEFDELDSPDTLSDEQVRAALEAKKLISGWLDAVEQHVSDKLRAGETFDGFKLVAGRSLRKWGDETKALSVLLDELGDDAYERKLLSVAKAEKTLGKAKNGLPPRRAIEIERLTGGKIKAIDIMGVKA